jgi:tetratricopeptide (TPR) repeat protein
MGKKVLLIANELIPIKGNVATGGGIRTWGVGEGLRSRGHKIYYSIPQKNLIGMINLPDHIRKYSFGEDTLSKIIDEISPDVIICQHWLAADYLPSVKIPVVIDLAVPLLLEGIFKDWDADEAGVKKIKALQKGDFFICANERQRSYYLAWLMMAGVDLKKRHIDIIPISLSPKTPSRQAGKELTFVYSGTFWPWQNPDTALMSVLKGVNKYKKGYLKIIGGKFPLDHESRVNYKIPLNKAVNNRRVIRQEAIPFDSLVNEYCRASCAVDVMNKNIEREHASPIRTMIYLWCGLPVISGDYMAISPLINEYNAGWTVSDKDRDGIDGIIGAIIKNPSVLGERSRSAVRLIKERFNWEDTIEPLDRFLQMPFRKKENGIGIVNISLAYGFSEKGVALRKERKFKEAVENFKKAVENYPSIEGLHLELGITYRELGDMKNALEEFKIEAKLYPKKAAVYHNRGIVYRMQNKYKEALKEFNKAINIDPKAEWTHYDMGITYREMGDIKNAIEEIKMEDRLYPGKAAVLYSLYSVYGEIGEKKSAAEGFYKVLKVKGVSVNFKAGCYFHLGKIYFENNEKDKAVKFFKKCLKLMPKHRKAKEYLELLA